MKNSWAVRVEYSDRTDEKQSERRDQSIEAGKASDGARELTLRVLEALALPARMPPPFALISVPGPPLVYTP